MLVGEIQNLNLQVRHADGVPELVLRWRPKTGEDVAMAVLPLGVDRAGDLRMALCQVCDQVIGEHLEGVHKVQANLENWLREDG